MPNPGADEPLTKVSLNLYARDVDLLRECYGVNHIDGYSTVIRQLVREHASTLRKYDVREDSNYD